MGNLDFSANADQLKELAAYMASQINVPTIGIGGGYAPIGSINFFDATVAPQDWLACDGTVYNIADYPQLADWYEAQHGSKNFYGGNGTTTFAVPDLQGEFLRGTGTNSHTNQGNGAAVGEHQDGTVHTESTSDSINTYITSPSNFSAGHTHTDHNYTSTNRYSRELTITRTIPQDLSAISTFTSRPTNTSFLICVKAVVAGDVYSTEERVVGTWIDGKKIYQKIIQDTLPNADTDGVDVFKYIPTGVSIDRVIDISLSLKKANAYCFSGSMFLGGPSHSAGFRVFCGHNASSTQKNNISLANSNIGYNGETVYIILKYTKTAD